MSHHGTTRRIAEELHTRLAGGEGKLIDLEREDVPDLAEFSTVIVGGSIHMGHVQKEIKKFCEDREAELLEKRLGLFLCFMNKNDGGKEFESSFPESLRKSSKANGLFGGELLFDEMNFMERLVVRKVSGVKESVSEIDREAIERFIQMMQE